MTRVTGLFYDSDIAMLEHDFIDNTHPLELEQDVWRYYIAGVHDFAAAVIEKIREGVE